MCGLREGDFAQHVTEPDTRCPVGADPEVAHGSAPRHALARRHRRSRSAPPTEAVASIEATAAFAEGRLELVLGTAQLRRAYGALRADDADPSLERAQRLLSAAAHAVDALDTAPAYGDAEATIGRAGVTLPVHTKIDPALTPAASLSGSLARLGREQVDVLYLHDADEVLHGSGATLPEAHALVGRGTRTVGASVYELAQFDAAVRDERIEVIQAPINVLDRRIDGIRLRAAAERSVRVYARSVLLQGLLVAPPPLVAERVGALGAHVEAFQRAARDLGRSALEVAIAWVRALPHVDGIVIGALTPEELDEVVSAARSRQLAEDELDLVRALPVPAWEDVDPRRWTSVVP